MAHRTEITVSREPFQPKKTSKTFTGCWTCRTRKIKCDEGKPACLQCTYKNLACEGYGVRLQWITECSDSTHRRPLPGPSSGRSQRCKVTADASQQPLQHREIDSILNSIDAVEPGDEFKAAAPLFIQNFGVFDLAVPSADISASPAASLGGLYVPLHDIGELSPNLDRPRHSHLYHLETGEGHTTSSIAPSRPWNGEIISRHDGREHREQILARCRDDDSRTRDKNDSSPTGQYPDVQSFLAAPSAPEALHLSEPGRFLMHHYMHRVVNLFCVIDNQKSPWKLIHLPKALQSIGEMNINGSSTRIRDALRNALLSISAFCLSNDSTFSQRNDDATRWAYSASRYRGQSIKLLKDAVEKDLHTASPAGYKEFLATMLSMVTINVISGDTSTCKMHLNGALRLMNHARTWKSKYSAKAQSLHRIYFYLRTIYESTAVNAPGNPSNLSQATEATALWPIPDIADVENQTSHMDGFSVSSVASDLSTDMTTWECIYGIPQTLLILLSRSTQLITTVTKFRQKHQTSVIPEDVAEACDELESVIMDLRPKFEAQKSLPEEVPSTMIIHKTTVAFQNALIIYFAQHIRLLGHRYLEPYVQAVLASIKEIEIIKAEKQILAAPLYWPAFIAGSEAFDDMVQAQFKEWYQRVEVYGIESARTGIIILEQIWKDGPSTGRRRTSQWMATVQRMGVNLMLS